MGGWRRLHNEELHNLDASLDVISMIKSGKITLAGHVARMGIMRSAFSIVESEVKKPLGRPRSKWKDNIRSDLR
jgi:hypothetical protein